MPDSVRWREIQQGDTVEMNDRLFTVVERGAEGNFVLSPVGGSEQFNGYPGLDTLAIRVERAKPAASTPEAEPDSEVERAARAFDETTLSASELSLAALERQTAVSVATIMLLARMVGPDDMEDVISVPPYEELTETGKMLHMVVYHGIGAHPEDESLPEIHDRYASTVMIDHVHVSGQW